MFLILLSARCYRKDSLTWRRIWALEINFISKVCRLTSIFTKWSFPRVKLTADIVVNLVIFNSEIPRLGVRLFWWRVGSFRTIIILRAIYKINSNTTCFGWLNSSKSCTTLWCKNSSWTFSGIFINHFNMFFSLFLYLLNVLPYIPDL